MRATAGQVVQLCKGHTQEDMIKPPPQPLHVLFRFLRSNARRHMSASGYCPKCDTTHRLPTTMEARHQAQLLHQTLRSKNPPFTISRRGKMVGVLLCQDSEGRHKTLKAFAGSVNGKWYLNGWSPVVGGKGTAPNELPTYVNIQNTQNKLQVEQNDLAQRLRDCPPSASDADIALIRLELKEMIDKRRQLAWTALKETRKHQHVSNFCGEVDLLQHVFARNTRQPATDGSKAERQRIKMPAGAGDCCAPKLLADAARQDLTPLAIAEIFVGDTTMKKEGEFYDACKERCQPVLGFMLCGL